MASLKPGDYMIGETLNIHTSHTFEGHSVASESCGEKSQFRRPDTWFILNRSYPLGYAAKKNMLENDFNRQRPSLFRGS